MPEVYQRSGRNSRRDLKVSSSSAPSPNGVFFQCATLYQDTKDPDRYGGPALSIHRAAARVLLALAAAALLAAFVAACGGEPDPTPTPSVAPTATPAAMPTLAPTPTPASTATPTPTPGPAFDPGPVILPTTVAAIATPMPTPVSSGILDAKLDDVEQRASRLRERFAFLDVDREFIDQAELRERLSESLEENREDIALADGIYTTLGILDADTDLYELLVNLYTGSVLGFFDTDEDKIYIVDGDDELTSRDILTYAHEYAHALQHRNFDLKAAFDALEDADTDRSLAYRGLVEGDATIVEVLYFNYELTGDQQEEAREESTSSDDPFAGAPRLVRDSLVFPYTRGFEFTVQLFQRAGGWALIDDAFDNPPVSTEQVLHIDKYLEDETPVPVELPDLAGALGEGWTEAGQETFGEFLLASYLVTYGGGTADGVAAASNAAAGWGGDRLVLWEHADGGLVLAWRLAWDTELDAAEFHEAARAALGAQSDADWRPPDADDGELLDLPGRVVRLAPGATHTLVLFAPGEELLAAAWEVLSAGQ